jgi:predicted ATPase/tetratricopeptide (TPR) repeat protein
MELRIGSYRVLGELGSGGMARVYAARGPGGELRAIKVLTVPGAAARERFAREALVQHEIVHEHTLPLLEVLPVPAGLALVLPLVEGPSLATLLARHPPLGQRLALFRQVVEGVAAIHRASVVHRDLKPGNVLLQPEGDTVRARVADFGLAKPADGGKLTRTGAELGTPAYMAPEQRVDASRIGARADVWALGAMLCEMLDGGAGLQRAWLPEQAPPEWAELARQLVEPDPARRPADASAVLRLLPDTEPISPELAELCRALAPVPVPLEGPSEAPPTSVRGRLPRERDPFVGREAELVELSAGFDQGARLITLVGAAGVGKTRLVLHYAALCHEDWPGGVWFCELASARTREEVAVAVARSLDVPLGAGDPVAQLGHALAARGPCLLLLDNFEQLLAHAEGTVGAWLASAPQAQLLVTSRSPLGLASERVMTLSPLESSDACDLFVARARAARGGAALPAAEHARLPELVELLDRLPLALELCAARTRLLSVSEILSRMQQRFRLLVQPGGRALAAALQWSWELLCPWEQAALVQLSVFRGGFVLDAAEAVLDLSAFPDAPWALDVVDALVAHSLLQVGDQRRTSMLHSVQQFAQDKDPALARSAEARHGRYFAGLDDPPHELASELSNLMIACRRASARGDGPVAVRTFASAARILDLRGPFALGLALSRGLEGTPLTVQERAEVDLCTAWLLEQSGRSTEALALLEPALAQCRQLGDRSAESQALAQLAGAYQHQGKLQEAEICYESALTLSQQTGNRRHEATLRKNLAILLVETGRPQQALDQYQSALDLYRSLGDRVGEGMVLGNRSSTYALQGRYTEALADCDAALTLHREVGNRRFEALALSSRGNLHTAQGRLQEARTDLEAALALHLECGARPQQAVTERALGFLAELLGQTGPAETWYLAAAETARTSAGPKLEATAWLQLAHLRTHGGHPQARPTVERALALCRASQSRRSEGRTLSLLGLLLAREGEVEAARASFEAGETVLRELSDPLSLVELWGRRAQAHLEAGQQALAAQALAEADTLAVQLPSLPRSLQQELERLRTELSASARR